MPAGKIELIVDSGAYSAAKSGKPIDLDRYCDYLLDNQDWLDRYAALDVLDPRDFEAGAEASFANLRHMRKRGLDPIPVYHVGEDIKWLYRILDLGVTYIALGGTALLGRKSVSREWYDHTWTHLINSGGAATVKVHGFGEGDASLLRRYPWASADTTSWIYAAQRTGQLTLPDGRSLSMRADGNGTKSSPDIASLDPEERAVWHALLGDLNVNIDAFKEQGKTAWVMRAFVTALYYQRLQDEIRARQPIRFQPQGFFCDIPPRQGKAVGDPFNLYLVCSEANVSAFPIICKARHGHILVSYFYLSQAKVKEDTETRNFTLGQLKAFAADPIGFVSQTEPWATCWGILEKNVG